MATGAPMSSSEQAPHIPAQAAHELVDLHDTAAAQVAQRAVAEERLTQLEQRPNAIRRLGSAMLGKADVVKTWMKEGEFDSTTTARESYTAQLARLNEEQVTPEDLAEKTTALRQTFAAIPENFSERVDKRAQMVGIDAVFGAQKEAGRSWRAWLSDTEHGATDAQVLEIAKWDKNRVDGLQQLYGEQINRGLQTVQNKLKNAVAANLIDAALLKYTDGLPSDVRFAGAFDYSFSDGQKVGYKVENTNIIVIDGKPSISTLGHEDMHRRGGFGNRFWDEGATELLTQTTLNLSPSEIAQENTYVDRVQVLKDIMNYTNLTMKDLSRFFAGDDDHTNQQQFSNFVTEKIGFDVVTTLANFYEENAAQHINPLLNEQMVAQLYRQLCNSFAAMRAGTFDDHYRRVVAAHTLEGGPETTPMRLMHELYEQEDAIVAAHAALQNRKTDQ